MGRFILHLLGIMVAVFFCCLLALPVLASIGDLFSEDGWLYLGLIIVPFFSAILAGIISEVNHNKKYKGDPYPGYVETKRRGKEKDLNFALIWAGIALPLLFLWALIWYTFV